MFVLLCTVGACAGLRRDTRWVHESLILCQSFPERRLGVWHAKQPPGRLVAWRAIPATNGR